MPSATQVQSSLDNYKGLLKERGDLYLEKQRIEDRIKVIDGDLRPALEGRGEVVSQGYSFKCDITAGRKTVDYKKMADDYNIDMAEYTKVGKPSSRFTVKEVSTI